MLTVYIAGCQQTLFLAGCAGVIMDRQETAPQINSANYCSEPGVFPRGAFCHLGSLGSVGSSAVCVHITCFLRWLPEAWQVLVRTSRSIGQYMP